MSKTLLVLDDDYWQDLTWIEDLASSVGWTCSFAQTYDEAKALYAKERPAIAVVDIRIGDVDEPLLGATLQGADPQWVGLRFLNFVRVEQKDPATRLFVYTGMDRDALQRIVEMAYQGEFFTKFEATYFQNALRKAIEALSKQKP